jgi:hypothetical protein
MVSSKVPSSSDDEYASTSRLTDQQYTPTHSGDRTPPPVPTNVTMDEQARRERLSSPEVDGNDTDAFMETPAMARNAASLSSVWMPEAYRPVHVLTLSQK